MEPARLAIGQRALERHGAIGAMDLERERHVLDRMTGAVAQQGDELHRLAGAIDAAIAVHEGVGRARRQAAADAAIAEIEGGVREVEEHEIAVAAERHDGGRAAAGFAADQAGVEGRRAGGVAGGLAELVIVAGVEPQIDARNGLAGRQRADEHMQAIARRTSWSGRDR